MIPQALLEKFGLVYDPGDLVFAEFETGSNCFVVHSGEVSIVKISSGVEKVLAILKPGDIFGEMGVLERKPRTATAIAVTELTVLALDLRGLQALVMAQPEFAFKLGRTLGHRIIESYRHLANLMIENSRNRIVDILVWKTQEQKDGPAITPYGTREIADFAGLPFDETHKILTEFSQLGRLKVYGDKIEILDLRSLKRLLR